MSFLVQYRKQASAFGLAHLAVFYRDNAPISKSMLFVFDANSKWRFRRGNTVTIEENGHQNPAGDCQNFDPQILKKRAITPVSQ